MAEKIIRDLQDLTRTELIYSSIKWKEYITANLWPYAMRLANEALKNSPSPQDSARRTPEQIFSKTNVNINAKHFKPFGCQVYALTSVLQTNKPHHKWKQRSKVGIYLAQHGRKFIISHGSNYRPSQPTVSRQT